MFPLVQDFPLIKQKINRIRCLSLDQLGSCSTSCQLMNLLLFFKCFSFHCSTFDHLCVSQWLSPFVTPLKNDIALKAPEGILDIVHLTGFCFRAKD